MSIDWLPDLPGYTHDILEFYEEVSRELPSGAVCVELGVWCGKSLSWLHECFRRQDKVCTLVGVDLWPEGYSFAGFDERIAAGGGLYRWSMDQMFAHAPPAFTKSVRLLRWDSADAAMLFDDRSVDLVFVDAAHDFAHVFADIDDWLGKVRRGGVLAGHDYHPTDYPDVVRVVDRFFPNRRLAGTVWRAW